MSFHSKGKILTVLVGKISIEVKYNKHYINWTCEEDYRKLCFLARYHYKLKTHKKRIVKRYVQKLINAALKDYIKDH